MENLGSSERERIQRLIIRRKLVDNMMKASTQKILAFILALGGIASLAGTWGYLPHRQEKIEQIVEKDHDTLIRIETKVEQLEKKLERNGIVFKHQNENQLPTNLTLLR